MELHASISQQFFINNNLQLSSILDLLEDMHRPGVDAADIFMQHFSKELWVLENGKLKHSGFEMDCGVGFQLYHGLSQIHTYTQDFSFSALHQAAQRATSICKTNSGSKVGIEVTVGNKPSLYHERSVLSSWTDDEKKAFLLQQYDFLMQLTPKISQSTLRLSLQDELVLVIDTSGRMAFDIRPMVRLDVFVVLTDQSRNETGYYAVGGRYDCQDLQQNGLAELAIREAVRIANLNFSAQPAPAGMMPVVLGSGFTGILLHEAVGHGFEGDFIRKKTSCFASLIGQKIASDQCNIVDNGAIANVRGALNIDDEGTPTQKTTLISSGEVAEFMYDQFNARLMGKKPTGNGRRESYAYPVMPRMTNTYMEAGQFSQAEMIANLDSGILALDFGSGQVDITTGQFVFTATESYLIEAGRITTPLKGVTLAGNGFETLQKISMVGDDLEFDKGAGTCGKAGQSVPVCVGQPSILVDELLVGGTEVNS